MTFQVLGVLVNLVLVVVGVLNHRRHFHLRHHLFGTVFAPGFVLPVAGLVFGIAFHHPLVFDLGVEFRLLHVFVPGVERCVY